MNKFIRVSLTLLMVASLASAAVIESPASHMAWFDPEVFHFEGFARGAIVVASTGGFRRKTKAFVASDG